MHHADWRYLAEGNANVIFYYVGEELSQVQRKVLRLQKKSDANSFDASAQQDYLASIVTLALKSVATNILSGVLVPISAEDLKALNNLLRDSTTRPDKFRGSTIDTTAKHGILLPLLHDSVSHKILEFKPKWLTQSSSAPSDARLCRTCAVRSCRKASMSLPSDDLRFCPLDLASRDQEKISRACHGLNRENKWNLTNSQLASLTLTFLHHPLIDELTSAQASCGNDIALAMTLRDCSVYVEMDRATGQVHNLWIADLDRKPLSKMASWQAIEKTLRDEGWYHGRGLALNGRSCLQSSSV